MGIPASQVKQYLRYEPTSGEFTRALEKRCGKNNSVVRYRAGDKAGCIGRNGYVQIAIEGKIYLAHRLAFALMTDSWPPEDVDHINGQRSDNRFSNLRLATRGVNMQNRRGANPNSKSGLLGTSKSGNHWVARIFTNGKATKFGRFDTPEEAHAAYIDAKRVVHAGCTI